MEFQNGSLLLLRVGICTLCIFMVAATYRKQPQQPSPPVYIINHGNSICSYDVKTPNLTDAEVNKNCFWTIRASTFIVLETILSTNSILVAHDESIYEYRLVSSSVAVRKMLLLSASRITDMSVDWISGNIYYTDNPRKKIMVVTINGTYPLPIHTDIKALNGIAVDPIRRNLFWTTNAASNTAGGIAKSGLDGSNRDDTFYKQGSPFYLCMDHKEGRLYWTDYLRGTVESILVDGTGHQVLISNLLYSPFNLAVTYDHVIWTGDHLANRRGPRASIYWTLKSNGTHSQRDGVRFNSVDDIVYFGNYSQPAGYSNGCSGTSNGGCSQICVPTTASDVVCKCSLGYILDSDGKICKPVHITIGPKTLFVGDTGHGSIFAVDTTTQKISAIPIPKQSYVLAIAVDPDHKLIFWSNIVEDTISRTFLNGSDLRTLKHEKDHIITSLSIDSHQQKVFYGDFQNTEVAYISYDGETSQKILTNIWVHSLVADTVKEHLYMTEYHPFFYSRLLRVNYDGTGKKILLRKYVYQPRGLSIDFTDNTMYWTDFHFMSMSICRASLNGSNLVKYTDRRYDTDYMSTAVQEDYLYIADWGNNNQLKRIHRKKFTKIEKFGQNSFLHTTGIFAFPLNFQANSTTAKVTTAISTKLTTATTPSTITTTPTTKPTTTTTATTKPTTTTTATTKPTTTTTATTKPTTTTTATTKPTIITPTTTTRFTTQPTTTRPTTSTSTTVTSTISTKTTSRLGTTTTTQLPVINGSADTYQSTDNTSSNNTVLIAAILGVIVLLAVVAVVVGTSIFIKMRAPRPLPTSNNNAFENPGYVSITNLNALRSTTTTSGYNYPKMSSARGASLKKINLNNYNSKNVPDMQHNHYQSNSYQSSAGSDFLNMYATESGIRNQLRRSDEISGRNSVISSPSKRSLPSVPRGPRSVMSVPEHEYQSLFEFQMR